MESFIHEALVQARLSSCLRRKCGAVIVSSGKIIGRGFNSPPGNLKDQRRCDYDKKSYDLKITDKTCCVHAEQRAIFDALIKHADLVKGSTLYFVSCDDSGELIPSGEPYCTVCSKSALDVGIASWVLVHEHGSKVYDSADYNLLSFKYKK